jgi:hypothetical protein
MGQRITAHPHPENESRRLQEGEIGGKDVLWKIKN